MEKRDRAMERKTSLVALEVNSSVHRGREFSGSTCIPIGSDVCSCYILLMFCIVTLYHAYLIFSYLILSHLSRSLADSWGTTVDFTTSFLHSSRFSAFRSMIFHSKPVHSLMLSSHRFLCLPLRLPP